MDTELKKPHPSRLVVEAEVWNRLVSHPREADKNSGGISWESKEDLAPHPLLQGSSVRKINPRNLFL